jgi:hypothetical protein
MLTGVGGRAGLRSTHVGGGIVLVDRYNLLTRLHGRTFPGPP